MGRIWKLKEVLLIICILQKTTHSTQPCVWSALTIRNVTECPATEEGTQKAARIKKCLGTGLRQNCTNPLQFKYHCLYSLLTETLVEVCAAEMSINGVCLVYNTELSKLDLIQKVKCTDLSTPCPENYLSTKAHLDAPCHKFINLTSNFTSNEEKKNKTDTENILLWSLLPTVLVIVFVINIVIIVTVRRKKSLCWKRTDTMEMQDTEAARLLSTDQISTLTDDEVSVLYCFLCSDSGPPDFIDTEWLDMLNEIRQRVCRKEDPVTSEEAQQTLDGLKSRDFLWADQTRKRITGDTHDEIMYRVSYRVYDIDVVYYLSSFITSQRYLRSGEYNRKPGEKCVTGYSRYSDYCDTLLIRRLQMDILTHVTMEDTGIFDEVSQILNIPLNTVYGTGKKREKFKNKLKGERVHYRGRSEDSVQHVKWLWRHRRDARPDIVRSCIGLHPHSDIYIIDNMAYRQPSRYHTYTPDVRCLLYCLLLVDHYNLDVNERPNETLLSKLKERYFTDPLSIDDKILSDVPDGIIDKQGSKLKFKSDEIRHDVMYAFVTECLVEDSDLEFFLTTATRDVISEYCRSWKYEMSEGERCLYVPSLPQKMYDLFIDKLQLDIITHCTVSDRGFHASISKRLGVPQEVLQWGLKARKRYVEYAKRGAQTVHHARGMIVGCAGAGKTTLLRRLMGCTEEELRNVKPTERLEVHEEIFEIKDETKTLKAFALIEDDKKGERFHWGQFANTLSFFDFGGQFAYYACHQIYLTRRAFYIVVVDASKPLDQMVDKAVCDQDGSVFSGWTYGGEAYDFSTVSSYYERINMYWTTV